MNRLPGELGGGGSTVTVLGITVPVQPGGPASGPVDALDPPGEPDRQRRPRAATASSTGRTFLGAVTRVAVRLSGDTEVSVDVSSTVALAMTPGTAVEVGLPVRAGARRAAARADATVPVRPGPRSGSRRSGCGTTARARTAGTRSPASG